MSGERRSAAERKKERLRALLYLAEQDTDAARLLAAHGNHYAAYHCQQAAEKLIRALLLQHDIEPGLGHHLDVLIGRLPDGRPVESQADTAAQVHAVRNDLSLCDVRRPRPRVSRCCWRGGGCRTYF